MKKIKKKILVTGAGGYIGSILVPMLIKKNFFVIAVDKFFFGKTLENNKNLKILKVDCRKINKNLFKDIYCVVDLVAISNDPSGDEFSKLTLETNFKARLRNAEIAKQMGVNKYILASTCSVYGNQKIIVNENSKVKPLTIYAKSNLKAEQSIAKLKSKKFNIIILRQATLFGYSPRMRFDLAINGMTEGVFKNKILPIMRDGQQYRPLCHVKDTSRLMCHLINLNYRKFNGEIFNVGSKQCTKKIIDLARIVIKNTYSKSKLEWYGNPDHRSYRVSFNKLKKLNFKTIYNLDYGVREMFNLLKKKLIKKNKKTITLNWYKYLKAKNKFLN
ncbi:NAD-dependent epimerase/dehydratase family protein [Candidatus Pelagibacter sp. HIMB1509]|uniref:NAD-dependent epimerase/dehydratase family protein n=1 Tax=Candidatus Pelagibacter sp. HIMB1509 TaxID=3413339 RepID=UPI003F84A5CD